mmetsp:Transcript_120512/g.232554  ORF Transcript_120512/g.232554 Transcript_120512/m.232554 type:complete len:202 (-) Transcript_120512:724-1329(-)
MVAAKKGRQFVLVGQEISRQHKTSNVTCKRHQNSVKHGTPIKSGPVPIWSSKLHETRNPHQTGHHLRSCASMVLVVVECMKKLIENMHNQHENMQKHIDPKCLMTIDHCKSNGVLSPDFFLKDTRRCTDTTNQEKSNSCQCNLDRDQIHHACHMNHHKSRRNWPRDRNICSPRTPRCSHHMIVHLSQLVGQDPCYNQCSSP